MKRFVVSFVLLLAAVAGLVWGFCSWQRRPGRPVVTVNGRALSAQELDWRAETLLADAKRAENLAVPAAREAEALAHYRKAAAKTWIVKQIFLAAAVARGLEVTPADEREFLDQTVQALRRKRGLTMEQYLNEGPMPPDVKRRDVREGVLANKLMRTEVLDRINVTGQEARERIEKNQRLNLMETKPGEKPKHPTNHKEVIRMIRAERFNTAFRAFFRSLFHTVVVKCADYPELETLEGIAPSRPGEAVTGGGKESDR